MSSNHNVKGKYTVRKVKNQQKQRCVGHAICRNFQATKMWIKYDIVRKKTTAKNYNKIDNKLAGGVHKHAHFNVIQN